MKKSVAVLGLGKYGSSLSENLYRLGADVLAVDCSEELISDFTGRCTSAVCANLSNEEEVASLGLKNMDIVVVAMGGDLAASIMSVTVAKEQGVPVVVAKAASDRMATILKRVGADKILDPEGEGGIRSAHILLSSNFKDFYELDENMYRVEMRPKHDWIGKNLIELDLRSKLNLNIVAVRRKGEHLHFVDPKTPFSQEDILLIVSEKKNLKSIFDSK